MSVISFGAMRSIKQLKSNRSELVAVLSNVRTMLARLFETGLIYHVTGSGAARQLLQAQEHLAHVLDTLDALPESADERIEEAERVHAKLLEVAALTQAAGATLKALKDPASQG